MDSLQQWKQRELNWEIRVVLHRDYRSETFIALHLSESAIRRRRTHGYQFLSGTT